MFRKIFLILLISVCSEVIPQSASSLVKEEPPIRGTVELKKFTSACDRLDSEIFHLDDDVRLEFSADRTLNSNRLEIWISECKNSYENSCSAPFMKKSEGVQPDWKSFSFEVPFTLKDIMSGFGKNKIPKKAEWFYFAVSISGKTAAGKMYKVKDSCD